MTRPAATACLTALFAALALACGDAAAAPRSVPKAPLTAPAPAADASASAAGPGAADAAATDATGADDAVSPPLPQLMPVLPYHPLNFYTRADLATLPPDVERPTMKPWCSGAYFLPPLPKLEGDDLGQQAPVYIAADSMQLDEAGESHINGGVEVRQGPHMMRADNAVVSADQTVLDLDGHVLMQDPTMTLEATHATLTMDGSKSNITSAQYALVAQHIRGSADRISRDASTRVEIYGGAYTTCEPGHDTWQLSADDIVLDQEEGWGSARDVTLDVHHLPVFYVPYVTFPLDKRRRTGMLYPTFSISGQQGLDVSVPIYLNLDPQADLLLTPRWIEQRGTLMQGQFRYLQGSPIESWGHGQLDAGYIDSDARYQDRSRAFLRYQHLGTPAEGWQVMALGTKVSDDDYLDDLGSQLSANRDTHLERVATVTYGADTWSGFARAQNFQTIDPTIPTVDRPYERLPQLFATATVPSNRVSGLEWLASAEAVDFQRPLDLPPAANPEGVRVRAEPGVRWNADGEWFQLAPAAKLRYAGYALEGDAPGNSPTRTVPTSSLDGQLFLERDMAGSHQGWVQTLEPRFYALWTPYVDQSAIPVFDASEMTFGYDQLFRDNRFTGGDRVGDTRQVSVAMESRLLDSQGAEAARFGFGQAMYAADRRVQLDALTPTDTAPRSPMVGEAIWRVGHDWRARAEGQWRDDNGDFVRGSVRLNWQDESFRTVNISWRYDRPTLSQPAINQTELSGLLPVHDQWTLVGREVYDTDNSRTVEALAGFEYESCCWRARILGRRALVDTVVNGHPNVEANPSIVFEIELKGLGSLGDKISSELSDTIPGYEKFKQSLQ